MIYNEPPPGCVVTWLVQFNPRGRQYQYAAVHIAGRGWYTTDTRRPSPWTWRQLQAHIGNAPCHVAAAWSPLPHVWEGTTVTFALPAGHD